MNLNSSLASPAKICLSSPYRIPITMPVDTENILQ